MAGTMKISDLVNRLNDLRDVYGDKRVFVRSDSTGWLRSVYRVAIDQVMDETVISVEAYDE